MLILRILIPLTLHGLSNGTNIYGLTGSTVQLECPYNAVTGFIEWVKFITETNITTYSSNSLINPKLPQDLLQRLSITGNHAAGEYHLTISDIRQSDGGKYQCLQSTTSSIKTLVVIEAPSSVNIENVSPDDKLLGTEGQDLIIRCTAVDGNPVPDVTILVSEISVQSGKQSVQYTLKAVARLYDGQTVLCKASNNPNTPEQRTDTATIYLNLKPLPPVFSQDPVSVAENKLFVVSCTSHGSRPAATFMWLIGDGNINVTQNSTQQVVPDTGTDTYTLSSTLTYRVNRSYNKKNIVCGASNTATTVSVQSNAVLDVKYAPAVTVPNKTLQQTQTPRTVECVLDGNPAIYTFDKWQHRSKHGELIRELDGNSTLILPTVPTDKLYQDTGEYTCTASNGIMGMNGTVKQTGSGYIISNALPVFTKDNSVSDVQFGEIGKNKMLFVNVYSVPKYSSTRWYKGNMELTSSKYVASEETTIVRDTFHGVDVQLDGYRVTLTINRLTQKDFDNYTLCLYSSGQKVEHIVMLESASAPQPPTNFSITDVTDYSITMTWIPGYDGGHQQTLHIQYRVWGSVEWKLVDIPIDHNEQQSDFMSYTLTGLQHETKYQIRMYADNKFNSSLPTDIMNVTTKQTTATDRQTLVGGIVGGLAGGLVIVIIVLVVIVLKKRTDASACRKKLRSSSQSEIEDDLKHKILYNSKSDGLKDNILYQPAGPAKPSKPIIPSSEYAEIQKPAATYADVDKKANEKNVKKQKGKKKTNRKKGKALNNQLDEEYSNTVAMNNLENGDYANTADTVQGITDSTPGLKYAVLSFDTKGKQRIIHGLEDKTVYSEVDHNQQAPAPPQESAYEETNIRNQRNA